MADPTDSDQAIRDIVAQLQGIPPAAPVAALPPQGVMPAPGVTPTMVQGTGVAPGAPMSLAPPRPAPAPDDWSPPAPTMTAPPVSPLGQMAALRRPAAPAMGGILMPQPGR